jgi:predicted amidohydrolase YtcJ
MDSPKAEIVLLNGRVFRGLAEGTAGALAISGGRVLAVGSDGEIEPLIGRATRVIDLRGRLASPGLYDAHLHLLPVGLAMAELDVRPRQAPTLAALLAKIRDSAAAARPGAWVTARGYDQSRLDVKRHPTRHELDEAAPENPVHLVRCCGHVSIVNSAALRIAQVDESTSAPAGGVIEKRDGRLTGLFAESARDRIRAVLPAVTDADLVAAIERAGRHCLSFGITSVMDAAVGSKAGFREIAAYRTARATGRLPVRVNQCLLGGPGGIVDRAYAEGLVTGAGDDRLSVGPVKIFTDGSAGARTAAMSTPYLGEPANQGLLCLAPQELSALVRDYHARGYQLAIHAIGDCAIDQVLDAYGLALDDTADADRRHRIEHCSFVRPDQIARMARLGVHPVPQPVFIHEYGELYVAVVGAERTAASHPMRSWIEAGLKPAASTDGPVSGIEPFPNLYAMLARRSSAGTPLGPAQALTMPEALAAYTAHGAYVNRAERHRGRLMPGLAADVAVFSRDLLAASPEEVLADTVCDLTLLGGEIVHDRLGEVGARVAPHQLQSVPSSRRAIAK